MHIRHQLAAYSPIPGSATLAALASGLRLNDDPRRALADLLAARYHSQHTLLCASGTQALELALRVSLRDSRPDASIALPAYTCYDVATAAVGCNAPISLYDLDPESQLPILESLGLVLAVGAAVVVVSPLYGYPCTVADTPGAGRSLQCGTHRGCGTGTRGLPGEKVLGSLGTISILSFGRGKGWTGGGGGAVLMRNSAERYIEDLPKSRFPEEVAAVPRAGCAVGAWPAVAVPPSARDPCPSPRRNDIPMAPAADFDYARCGCGRASIPCHLSHRPRHWCADECAVHPFRSSRGESAAFPSGEGCCARLSPSSPPGSSGN